jgi:hypothetical protein
MMGDVDLAPTWGRVDQQRQLLYGSANTLKI